METSAGIVLLASILTNNILLTRFLGMCPFLAISKNIKSALGYSAALIFVMTCTTALNYLIYYGMLVPDAPLGAGDLTHLAFLIFILTIAAFTQLVEIVIERVSPVLYYSLGVFLPLITVHCAILGAALFMIVGEFNFLQSLMFGMGSGIGWSLVMLAMAGIRERIAGADIPGPLKGLGISLIVTGMMAMAFMGFKGIVEM